jgi:hypothetical protein
MPRELRGVYKKMILYPTKTKFPEIFTYGATFFHTADLDSSPSVPLCQTSVLPKKRYPAKLEKLIPYIHILYISSSKNIPEFIKDDRYQKKYRFMTLRKII